MHALLESFAELQHEYMNEIDKEENLLNLAYCKVVLVYLFIMCVASKYLSSLVFIGCSLSILLASGLIYRSD